MKPLFEWHDAINPERVEMVFANRNKEYGGYQIRKKYQSRVVMALMISVFGIVLIVGIPKLVSVLSKVNMGAKEKVTDVITLAEPPPIDKTPPPPPVIPPPPVQQTIKFTPPKVVKDEEVEEPPPTQEETKEVQVATTTQEGVKDLPDLPPDPVAEVDEKPFIVVEEMPSFPGGEDKLIKYIRDNIKYPPVARENGIQGRVYVTFVIDKDGKIKDLKLLRGIGGGCDEEAMRVVKSMPDWKPGRQNGRNVPVQYNLPVNFTLR